MVSFRRKRGVVQAIVLIFSLLLLQYIVLGSRLASILSFTFSRKSILVATSEALGLPKLLAQSLEADLKVLLHDGAVRVIPWDDMETYRERKVNELIETLMLGLRDFKRLDIQRRRELTHREELLDERRQCPNEQYFRVVDSMAKLRYNQVQYSDISRITEKGLQLYVSNSSDELELESWVEDMRSTLKVVMDELTKELMVNLVKQFIDAWDASIDDLLPEVLRNVTTTIFETAYMDFPIIATNISAWTVAQVIILGLTFLCFSIKQRRLASKGDPTSLSQMVKSCLFFCRPAFGGACRVYRTVVPLGQTLRDRQRQWRIIDLPWGTVFVFWALGVLKGNGVAGLIEWVFVFETIDVFYLQILPAPLYHFKDPPGVMSRYHSCPNLIRVCILQFIIFLVVVSLVPKKELAKGEFYTVLRPEVRNVWIFLSIGLNATLAYYLLAAPEAQHLAKPMQQHCREMAANSRFCDICRGTVLSETGTAASRIPGVHHKRVNSLRISAENGCRICSTVWDQRTRILRNSFRELFFWKSVTSYRLDTYNESFTITSNDGRDDADSTVVFRLANPIAETLAIEVKDHTGKGVATAFRWLNNCVENHKTCSFATRTSAFTPTRLLRLVGKTAYLCQNDGKLETALYATLSHCWGDTVPTKLLAGKDPEDPDRNIEKFYAGLAVTELPQTFQDAIKIVQYLKIEYIWIDSLCIIQDSNEDWNLESVKMGQVYKHSICNIAAADARDGREGCLYPRNTRTIQPEPIRPGCVLVNGPSTGARHHLYNRAWVLQEMILAPRTLDCARDQLSWRCSEMTATEIYPSGVTSDFSHLNHPTSFFKLRSDKGDTRIMNAIIVQDKLRSGPTQNLLARRLGASPIRHHTDKSTYWFRREDSHPLEFWAQLVENYSEMQLTYPTDRPVAIIGIVDMLRPFLKEYRAGLWQIFLPLELLWNLKRRELKSVQIEYPTWSWLSAAGTISYAWCRWNPDEDQFLAEFLYASDFVTLYSPTIRDPKVDDTELCMRGLLLTGTWARSWQDASVESFKLDTLEGKDNLDRTFRVPIMSTGFGTVWFDNRSGPMPPEDIICFPILSSEDAHYIGQEFTTSARTVRGLVLQPAADREGTYKRIGVFEINEGYNLVEDIINKATQQDIILL